MICPYCVEDVPAGSQRHDGCQIIQTEFPPFYMDYHGAVAATDPVILSVVGFSGHGKTVFLCALFEYLDQYLTAIWPDFFNLVLDQDSLSTLNAKREALDDTKLPARTPQSFPRPGIFRLTNMPCIQGNAHLPPLVDTTILIYDPPGEAFLNEAGIVKFARFVKRSNCVLFLIDLTALGDSIPSKMAKLLDTYLLGMRRMGIEKKSQHMIVVYTKSDDIKVSVPEFENYLEREPMLKAYLNEQTPRTLANPQSHLVHLQSISNLLDTFTRTELRATKFIHVAKEWFASVSYTVVSSLGAAPEKSQAEDGQEEMKLKVKMSPRCVADPLLHVLAKSIKIKEEPPPPPRPWVAIALIAGIVALVLGVILISLIVFAAQSQSSTTAPPPGMAYVKGGEFTMGSTGRDLYESPPHKEMVKPFFIDVYEVTCEEYARFLKKKGRTPPPSWLNGQYPQGAAKRPVTGVTWDDAVAYASWAGKRLPTEKEWEFAARGTDGRLYPWGGEWKVGMANAGGVSGGGLADVGTFKGISPFNLYDMVGNAWEWTASDLKPYPGGQLPEQPPGELKIIRGGSWKEDPRAATTTYRGYLLARGSKDYSSTGFRCAQDVTVTSNTSGESATR